MTVAHLGSADNQVGGGLLDSFDVTVTMVSMCESVAGGGEVPVWLRSSAGWVWRGGLLAAGGGVALLVAVQLRMITGPLIIAAVLTTVTVPLVDRLQAHRVPRSFSSAAIVLSALVVLSVLSVRFVPALVSQLAALLPQVQLAGFQLLDWAGQFPFDLSGIRAALEDPSGQLDVLLFWLQGRAAVFAVAVGEAATIVVLTLLLWFFLLRDANRFAAWAPTLIRSGQLRATSVRCAVSSWRALGGFMRGSLVVALIDAVGIGVGLWALGVPLVVPLSVLVFFGGFVPILGATVTGMLAVAVAFAHGGLPLAAGAALVVLVVQQVESNLLQPLVMRRAVRLHPAVTLGSLTVGVSLAGVVGAFLAVPLAAMVAAVSRELRVSSAA